MAIEYFDREVPVNPDISAVKFFLKIRGQSL